MRKANVLKAMEKAGATIEHKDETHFVARFQERYVDFSGDNGTDDAFALWVGNNDEMWENVNQTLIGYPVYTIKAAVRAATR